jgi:hypothetical protein
VDDSGAAPDEWIRPPKPAPPTGEERFIGLDATLRCGAGFWSFALSDLLMNNARGYLAEYLVARAVGANKLRVAWDAYDVLTSNGTGVKVGPPATPSLRDHRGRRGHPVSRSGMPAHGRRNAVDSINWVRGRCIRDRVDSID